MIWHYIAVMASLIVAVAVGQDKSGAEPDPEEARRVARQRIAARVRHNVRILMGAEDPVD